MASRPSQCVTISLQIFPHPLQCASSHPYKSSLIPYNVRHHIPTNLPSSLTMCVITSLQIFPNPLQCASSHPYKSSLIPYNVRHHIPSNLPSFFTIHHIPTNLPSFFTIPHTPTNLTDHTVPTLMRSVTLTLQKEDHDLLPTL